MVPGLVFAKEFSGASTLLIRQTALVRGLGWDTTVDNPHDKLFRVAFSDTREAKPLLQFILPKTLAASIEWTSLRVVPGTFVDDGLTERRTDILYSATTDDGRPQLIYVLLEHQSQVDPMMAFRMFEYVSLILRRWRRGQPHARVLPAVVPVVVYAGDRPWTAPTAVEDLFGRAPEDWMPRMRFLLDDLSRVSDEVFARRLLGVFGDVALRALLRLPRSPDPVGELARWLPLLRAMVEAPGGLERLRHVIEYLAAVADLEPEALQPVVRQLGPAAEETAMTLAERLRQQGRQEGRRQNAVETTLRLLRLKFGEPLPASVSTRVEAGTPADFERWSERLLTATELEQVFDDSPLG